MSRFLKACLIKFLNLNPVPTCFYVLLNIYTFKVTWFHYFLKVIHPTLRDTLSMNFDVQSPCSLNWMPAVRRVKLTIARNITAPSLEIRRSLSRAHCYSKATRREQNQRIHSRAGQCINRWYRLCVYFTTTVILAITYYTSKCTEKNVSRLL